MERFIGSIRRECLDHVLIVSERGLRRVIDADVDDDARSRTPLALAKDPPSPRAVRGADQGPVLALAQVGGLHHRSERRAA